MGSKTEDTSAAQLRTEPKNPIIEKSTRWNGLTKGDECFIVGDREGVYTFQEWFVYANGNECVQLYGGPKGYRKTRFVGADVVTTDRAGRGRSAPVQEGSSMTQSDTPVGDYQARRKELGLSRQQLADAVGTTHAAVASVEAGRSPRDKEAPAKMAAFLWAEASPAPVLDIDPDDPEDEEDEW